MAKTKKSPLKTVKVEEAQVVVDPLKKFYVKPMGAKSTWIEVWGVSKDDVGRDHAGYIMEGDKPVLRMNRDVFTDQEMIDKGYFGK